MRDDGSVPERHHDPLSEIAVDFPRRQRGGASQHTLVTLFAEFWGETDAYLPARVVLELAEQCGLPRTATSPGLSRLKAREVIESQGSSRSTAYRLTAKARRRLAIGFDQVVAFGLDEPWDGTWTLLTFTVPERDRARRESLRGRLEWRGFAPFFDGTWVGAGDRTEEAEDLCRRFGVAEFFSARMTDGETRGRSPSTAWKLDEPPAEFDRFVREADLFLPTAAACSPAEAFAARVRFVDAWRAFPWESPALPGEFLPNDWPLATARERFLEVHAASHDGARRHVARVLAEHDPALVAHALMRRAIDDEGREWVGEPVIDADS